MAGYAGACHRAALRADPVGSNPPYALHERVRLVPIPDEGILASPTRKLTR